MTTEEAVVRVAKVAGGAVGGNEGGRKEFQQPQEEKEGTIQALKLQAI